MARSPKKGLWMSFIITFILCTPSQKAVVQGGATKSVMFEKVSSTNQRLKALASYTGLSVLTCASRCLSSVKRRGYFTHNAAQQTCACGLTLLPSPLAPGDSLYEPKCDQPGYSLHVLSSARVCVKYVDNKVSFPSAETACAQDGSAYVFMADNQEKIDLIRLLKPSGSVWIGLDDRKEEGVFRWSDGRVATGEQMKMFRANEPDDYYPGEDCVQVANSLRIFFDVQCESQRFYICEIPTE